MTRSDHSRRRFAVAVVLAVCFTAGAAYCHHKYVTKWAVITGWLQARPGELHVDFSRLGTATLTLPPASEVHHHGYSFHLEIDEGTIALEPMADAVPSVEIRVQEGQQEPLTWTIEEVLKKESRNGTREIWYTNGECTLTVRVDRGVPELAGKECVIHARYQICEMVALPAIFWGLLSWVAGVPAFILWCVAIWRGIKCFRGGRSLGGNILERRA